jgi:hypothetical protein
VCVQLGFNKWPVGWQYSGSLLGDCDGVDDGFGNGNFAWIQLEHWMDLVTLANLFLCSHVVLLTGDIDCALIPVRELD